MAEVNQFFRARFTKQGDVRFISHHDLLRVFERALRRAGLPVALSQGFNPRPQMSVPAPLSVGMRGEAEAFDFELSEWVKPDDVRERLASQLPAGIELTSLQCTGARPDRRVRQVSYSVPLMEGHPVTGAALEEFLRAEEITVQRCRDGEAKSLNIAPYVRAARLKDGALHILLDVTDGGTARPEEVLGALGCRSGRDYLKSAMVRTHVNLSSSL